jgi:hypothetical protein
VSAIRTAISAVVPEKESSYTGFYFAVDDSPIDGSCTPIMGQQRSMKVECTVTWHRPHHLRKHPKGNYDLKVGTQALEVFKKFL